MNPATLTAAIASAEARVAVIEARAASLAGTPSEQDVLIIASAARRQTSNLRQLLAATERRTA
jgi:hypothetical protein